MKNLCERKQHSVYIFLFLLCLVGFTAGVSAQYTVKDSDTLWGIAEKNTEPKIAWETIYNSNAFLQEPGRRFVDGSGRIIVVIHEGEILQGVNSEGLVPPTPNPTSTPTPTPTTSTATVEEAWWEKLPWWLILLLIAIPASFLLGLLGNWLYRRNPTEWRPMVVGGVSDGVANMRFNTWAQRRRATVIPRSVRKVRLYGVWGTQHRGIPISVPHNYNGERAYAARFRMPNGTEREGIMLQGCGNDVASGAWYVEWPGARMEEGWGDENSSNPKPPTPADPTPAILMREPAKAEGSTTARSKGGTSQESVPVSSVSKKTTQKFITFTSPDANGPSMIRWNGIDVHSMHIDADGTRTLRFTEDEE